MRSIEHKRGTIKRPVDLKLSVLWSEKEVLVILVILTVLALNSKMTIFQRKTSRLQYVDFMQVNQFANAWPLPLCDYCKKQIIENIASDHLPKRL